MEEIETNKCELEKTQSNPVQNLNSHKEKKQNKKKKKSSPAKWVIIVLIVTFLTSAAFSFFSEFFISQSSIIVAFVILFILIFVNITFDIIGTATMFASVDAFLAMGSKKVKGAKKAVKLCKNAEKVSSICADIVGDVCGIISGAAGATIIVKLSISPDFMEILASIILSSLIAAITVGGKALGKRFAKEKSQSIILFISKALSIFSKG